MCRYQWNEAQSWKSCVWNHQFFKGIRHHFGPCAFHYWIWQHIPCVMLQSWQHRRSCPVACFSPVILFSAINLFMIFDPGFLIGIHHITVSPAADSDPSKPISFWRDCLKIKPSEFPNLFVDAFSQNFQIFADFSQHINCPAASSPTRSSWRARAASPPP